MFIYVIYADTSEAMTECFVTLGRTRWWTRTKLRHRCHIPKVHVVRLFFILYFITFLRICMYDKSYILMVLLFDLQEA